MAAVAHLSTHALRVCLLARRRIASERAHMGGGGGTAGGRRRRRAPRHAPNLIRARARLAEEVENEVEHGRGRLQHPDAAAGIRRPDAVAARRHERAGERRLSEQVVNVRDDVVIRVHPDDLAVLRQAEHDELVQRHAPERLRAAGNALRVRRARDRVHDENLGAQAFKLGKDLLADDLRRVRLERMTADIGAAARCLPLGIQALGRASATAHEHDDYVRHLGANVSQRLHQGQRKHSILIRARHCHNGRVCQV